MVCSIENCGNKVLARGLCSGHYKRWQTNKPLDGLIRTRVRPNTSSIRNDKGEKYCSKGHWETEDKFSVNNQVPDKLQGICKYHTNVTRVENLYNLGDGGWDKLLEAQNNQCAICKTLKTDMMSQWHIDHDHSCCDTHGSCGKCVRGILCPDCNWGLGAFKDSIARLENAIHYLENCASI